ncbi:hypothetical protein AB6A40_003471 [Gnathostoma spinigerum]|uniref:Peptidase S1 domain-containing protein n=1 Tax=Gnathostoma spinigerum TaxID=75299 RepID=A0ABD6EJM5_9BILA
MSTVFIVILFSSCSGVYSYECGLKAAPSTVLRVIGGSASQYSEWPWQALLYTFDASGVGMMCGATILSANWLMTAAHCVRNKYENTFVTVNANYVGDLRNTYFVKKQIVHSGWDLQTVSNDIALLEIDGNIDFLGPAKPICITKNDSDLIKTGSVAVITGYGASIVQRASGVFTTMFDKGLQQATISVIDHEKCARTWWAITQGETQITDRQICAGAFLAGTAPGDSGGPLQVINHDGRWYQIGITSFGANKLVALLDQSNYPGVYTRVSSYYEWINQTIREQRYSCSSSLSLYSLVFATSHGQRFSEVINVRFWSTATSCYHENNTT